MNILRIMEVESKKDNPFRFAGLTLQDLSQSTSLRCRQAVADHYYSPQEDFGSLLAELEIPVGPKRVTPQVAG